MWMESRNTLIVARMVRVTKGKPKNYGILRPILGSKVGARWKIDYLGPLKKSFKGKDLVVAIEHVTNWVEAKALSSESV